MLYLFILLFQLVNANSTLVFSGKAFNDNGDIVYKETHTVNYSGQKLLSIKTEYKNRANRIFASMNSRFDKNPILPEYHFKDSRFGNEAQTKNQNNQTIVAKKITKGKSKNKRFKIKENLITGQGLHNYLQIHFDELLIKEGHTMVQFLMPQSLDTFRFRIKLLKKTDKVVTFKIDFKSWFLRFIAPHIEVELDRGNKRLLSYKGPSNLYTDQEKMQNVHIIYNYDSQDSSAQSQQAIAAE